MLKTCRIRTLPNSDIKQIGTDRWRHHHVSFWLTCNQNTTNIFGVVPSRGAASLSAFWFSLVSMLIVTAEQTRPIKKTIAANFILNAFSGFCLFPERICFFYWVFGNNWCHSIPPCLWSKVNYKCLSHAKRLLKMICNESIFKETPFIN